MLWKTTEWNNEKEKFQLLTTKILLAVYFSVQSYTVGFN